MFVVTRSDRTETVFANSLHRDSHILTFPSFAFGKQRGNFPSFSSIQFYLFVFTLPKPHSFAFLSSTAFVKQAHLIICTLAFITHWPAYYTCEHTERTSYELYLG